MLTFSLYTHTYKITYIYIYINFPTHTPSIYMYMCVIEIYALAAHMYDKIIVFAGYISKILFVGNNSGTLKNRQV